MAYPCAFSTTQLSELTSILDRDDRCHRDNHEVATQRLVEACLSYDLAPIHIFCTKRFEDAKAYCEDLAAALH